MSKKRKKHGYAERLKYMHMLENGFSQKYIEKHFGINHRLLSRYENHYLALRARPGRSEFR